jgi:hypothetical protein
MNLKVVLERGEPRLQRGEFVVGKVGKLALGTGR